VRGIHHTVCHSFKLARFAYDRLNTLVMPEKERDRIEVDMLAIQVCDAGYRGDDPCTRQTTCSTVAGETRARRA
jgi:hypothetical protein